MGLTSVTDAKGNLIVPLGSSDKPELVVTAHLDEIAMIVRHIWPDGTIDVGPLGGLNPWKLGEGPVQILAKDGPINGILSFGSMHTEVASSDAHQAKSQELTWEMAQIWTGQSADDLKSKGVKPGTRVVVHPDRRKLTDLGEHVAGYFLDDRADLVAWVLALQELKNDKLDVAFVATVSEETGGEGALFYLHNVRPDRVIALELGPNVPDAPVDITSQPTVWANDSYSAASPADLDAIAEIAKNIGQIPQFQVLSRGGSDASCAASHGLCAHPVTLGLPMENTHGYEIIHRDSMAELARLTVALVKHWGEPG